MTRAQIEAALAGKYLGKVILIKLPTTAEVCGKVDRITCETAIDREPVVIFAIGHRRYEADVNYFIENAQIQKYGNTH